MTNEILSKAYHTIITELEIPKVSKNSYQRGIYTIRDQEYVLKKEEIVSHLKNKFKITQNDAERLFGSLRSKGFLVELPEKPEQLTPELFRTLHMDVLVRSSEIRTYWLGLRYIVTPRFMWKFVNIPSERDRKYLPEGNPSVFPSYKLYNSLVNFFADKKLVQDYIRIMKDYLPSGLDGYQAYSLASMLESRRKLYVITAPTGAGKTEIFFLYILAWLMKNYAENKSARVVLIYPRKSLSVDQSGRLIKLLKIANKYGYTLSFGLRDGHTPGKRHVSEGEIKDGDPFREIRCPTCGNVLVYDLKNGTVRCNHCKDDFSFVKSTRNALGKDNPNVIITNMWALEVRMMDNTQHDININVFSDVGIIVVDEAHEYTGLSGGLVSNLIKLLLEFSRKDVKIIVSSATMPNALEFASKLTHISKRNAEHYDFSEIMKKLKEYNISFKGRRLVLIGIFDINPKYSWSTYCQLWAVMMSFLNYAYSTAKIDYKPQSILFINNIKELRRTYLGYEENISLGEPRDHIIGPKEVGEPLSSIDSFSYWHYLPKSHRKELIQRFKKDQKLEELLEKAAEMHSQVKDEKAIDRVIRCLERGEGLGVVFSTSSLELGVDYQNVSFILNVGFRNPLSLIQRIGRGGRKTSTLKTVLGIILFRNTPSETLSIYRPDLNERLDPSSTGRVESLPVSTDNPQVLKRGMLVRSISMLAKNGKNTYASGKSIKTWDELEKFLSEIIELLGEET